MDIKASQKTPAAVSFTGTVSLDLEAKGSDGKPRRPTFSIVGYTGAVMNVVGFYSPVIVDLVGLKAGRDKIPILLGHDTDRIIGQTDGITIDSGGVRLTGTITGEDSHSSTVVSHARNGFEWQASIGASIIRQEFLKAGEKAVVNAREITGPMVIAREARLYETSFVAVGADGQTSASVAASSSQGSAKERQPTMFEAWLAAKGFDPAALSDDQKAVLKAAFDAEQKPAPKPDSKASELTASLDQILAAKRKDQERIAGITRITAACIEERPALIDEFETMSRTAVEAGSTVEEFELATLRVRASSGPAIHARRSGPQSARTIEATLCLAGGLRDVDKVFDAQTLEASEKQFPHGLGLKDLLVIAARENGYRGVTTSDVHEILRAAFAPTPGVQASGYSSFSLSGILGNTANKFLRMGFMAVESAWRDIAAIRNVRDFKTVTSYSLTGDLDYEKVGPAGEIKHGGLSETSYTNKAETYGRMLAITRTDIINDDLGALTQVPQRLGRGAALKMNDIFWTIFLNNSSFFTTARGNAIEGVTVGTNDSRLNVEGLTRAETAYYNLTDPDSKPLGITPRILLVPNALNAPAFQLMNSTELRDTTANTLLATTNPHNGKYRIVRSTYMSNSSYTGNSTTAWYILADPAELPVIEVALLNGRDMPIVESAEADFNTLGVQMRGYHDFGVALQEYRGGLRAKGAA
jgi:phage major head subunit gpT-like protein/phage head maturation protease